MKRYEYICFHNTDEGYTIDGFSLFADIVERTEETVTYHRYLKFGKIDCGIATIKAEEFEYYYQPLTDELYKECCSKENKQ